jgi:hypothetical protein
MCPSDLSKEQWAVLKPHVVKPILLQNVSPKQLLSTGRERWKDDFASTPLPNRHLVTVYAIRVILIRYAPNPRSCIFRFAVVSSHCPGRKELESALKAMTL